MLGCKVGVAWRLKGRSYQQIWVVGTLDISSGVSQFQGSFFKHNDASWLEVRQKIKSPVFRLPLKRHFVFLSVIRWPHKFKLLPVRLGKKKTPAISTGANQTLTLCLYTKHGAGSKPPYGSINMHPGAAASPDNYQWPVTLRLQCLHVMQIEIKNLSC